ncbi:MAG: AAA family ATPase [Acidobacteria bacterium]|nr:AAA family ATPase [Acidobacteriota bacterium]
MPVASRRPNRTDFPTAFGELASDVERAIRGKDETVRLALTCLLAEGHLLIEDVPGVGKTLLAKCIARSIGCTWRRIQFTPDLLPTDVTGVNVFNQQKRAFEFRPGAVFANVVLGDELNRASPKTQSALLEAMEERQVTVDGATHELARPFMVIATQNPIEHEGTYPLPAAQLDRFLMRIAIGYPSPESEVDVLHTHGDHVAIEEVEPVCEPRVLLAMMGAARKVHVSESVHTYIVSIAGATRRAPDLSLGASPRASLALLRAARVRAAAAGRDYVTPDDVKRLVPATLAHRLVLSPEAEMNGRAGEDILADLFDELPVSVGR